MQCVYRDNSPPMLSGANRYNEFNYLFKKYGKTNFCEFARKKSKNNH